MMRFRFKCAVMTLTLMLTAASRAQLAGPAQSRLIANYGKLPLRFEANRGQTVVLEDLDLADLHPGTQIVMPRVEPVVTNGG